MESLQKDEKPISTNSTFDTKSEVIPDLPQFHKILVPYDGSKMSDKALTMRHICQKFQFLISLFST